ncbi:hypothetical protein UG54_04940 [Gordonia sihwensis]|nr:hypothetical protein UG54_04940 [Gordonia sihwensis]
MCHDGFVNSIPDPLSIADVHVSLPVADLDAASRMYDLLLGESEGLRWAASNATVALRDGRTDADADAVEPTVDLTVADYDAAAALLRRRGLTVDDTDGAAAIVGASPLRITAGSQVRPTGRMLDHIVLTAPDADRAVALLGGRLGINLRLVRELGDGICQLFFRTRTVVIEVVAGAPDAGDRLGLMGLAWRTDDIVAERHRLAGAGLEVSDVRTGRKGGTRVCTVRERALGTATLLIEQ